MYVLRYGVVLGRIVYNISRNPFFHDNSKKKKNKTDYRPVADVKLQIRELGARVLCVCA